MARAAVKKVKPPKVIRHSPSAPAPVQAAQIAIIAMKAAKVAKWSDFTAKPLAELRELVTLDFEQQNLLETYRHLLPHLQTSPLVTVTACPVCGRHGLAGSTTGTGRCFFTLRCAGNLVRASVLDYRAPKQAAPADAAPGVEAAESVPATDAEGRSA